MFRAIHGLVLAVACLVVLVPLGYLIINSMKLPREFLTVPPTILPTEVTFQHYQELIDDKKTVRYFQNSLTVAVWTTGVTILTGTLAAYGLARMRLSAKILGLVTFIFLFIRFYPRVTTVIPFFLVMRQFDLLDTVWGDCHRSAWHHYTFRDLADAGGVSGIAAGDRRSCYCRRRKRMAAILARCLAHSHAECFGGGNIDGIFVLE